MKLKEIYNDHHIWITYSEKLTNDQHQSKDLVQDMYIKVINIFDRNPQTSLNRSYIRTIIKNIFIDNKRSKREYATDTSNLQIIESYQKPTHRKSVSGTLDNIEFVYREILLISQEKSLRRIAREANVDKDIIRKIYKKAVEKFKTQYNGRT